MYLKSRISYYLLRVLAISSIDYILLSIEKIIKNNVIRDIAAIIIELGPANSLQIVHFAVPADAYYYPQ